MAVKLGSLNTGTAIIFYRTSYIDLKILMFLRSCPFTSCSDLMSSNAGQIVAMVMAAKQIIPSLLATLGNHNRAKCIIKIY